jgi:hypothetical protein
MAGRERHRHHDNPPELLVGLGESIRTEPGMSKRRSAATANALHSACAGAGNVCKPPSPDSRSLGWGGRGGSPSPTSTEQSPARTSTAPAPPGWTTTGAPLSYSKRQHTRQTTGCRAGGCTVPTPPTPAKDSAASPRICRQPGRRHHRVDLVTCRGDGDRPVSPQRRSPTTTQPRGGGEKP